MAEPTAEAEALVKALASMAANLPMAALELREGRMGPARQHALGDLLVELGQLVHRHAEMDQAASPDAGSSTPPP
ncbi:hypothetical protein L1857_26295 [Amycolatopsis thermalba]|uniref:Uncharacterized protein n=1 Tax=Amycolatopsis thermalba TaxID=944492 RepID=A0ABY4P155_9PSEU|nr:MULTISPECIES: hypothetical protein [Amycolatopsis]UQS26074.1 hypothetical protein L1857_26295 [Amycolatopsis thermalba]